MTKEKAGFGITHDFYRQSPPTFPLRKVTQEEIPGTGILTSLSFSKFFTIWRREFRIDEIRSREGWDSPPFRVPKSAVPGKLRPRLWVEGEKEEKAK